jgi:hypothetical protein
MSKTCISPFLCFDSQTFYLLLGLTLVTCVYFYNNYQGKLVRDMNIDKVEFNTNNSLFGAPISDDPEVKSTLESKDYQRAINPLLPPERTYPYGNPSIQEINSKVPINVPTRGVGGVYSQVGILTAPDENNPTILPLYGKPTYPGSSRWLYYTSTDKLPSVKIPLSNAGRDCAGDQGCDEIQKQDKITIPAYAGKEFDVDIYKLDTPRYIPVV